MDSSLMFMDGRIALVDLISDLEAMIKSKVEKNFKVEYPKFARNISVNSIYTNFTKKIYFKSSSLLNLVIRTLWVFLYAQNSW